MSNLNKFGITEAQMLVLANKCELPYQFGSNWMAKFFRYNQELLALATPSPANGSVGEMPELPEPTIEGSVMHPELKICYLAPVHFTADQMQAHARAAVLAERERIAEICDKEYLDDIPMSMKMMAAHIRART